MKLKITYAAIAAIILMCCGEIRAQKRLQKALPICSSIEQYEENVIKFGRHGRTFFRKYDANDFASHTGYFVEKYQYLPTGGAMPVALMNCNVQAKLSTLCKFYSDLETLPELYMPERDFAAVRIHYGMEGQKLIMIFEPITLSRIGGKEGRKGQYRQPPVENFLSEKTNSISRKYYTLNTDGTATPLDIITLKRLVNDYQKQTSNIYITKESSAIHYYEDGIDVKYTVMLLQDAIEVYLHNRTGIPNDEALITFSFVASDMNTSNDNYQQHVVAYYGTIGTTGDQPTKKFSGYGADFSQMCPPHCSGSILQDIQIRSKSNQ